MAYGDFKDLTRGIADKILRDKAFSIAKNPKYDGYENGLVSMIYNFFDEKFSVSDIKNENMLKKESAEEFTNQLFENLREEKHTHLL